jgi:isoleucyl-tRNA synthetase
MSMFKELPKNPSYSEMECRVLRFWEDQRIFEKLREKNRGKRRFSFLDGPITANNPMGVHHAWGRTYKDIFQRFKAMTGHELRYQNGFDCQGLWVEVEVEKELGFSSKRDIEAFGIDRFVEQCKEQVRKFAAVQTEQSARLGYWMDWANSYYTMSDENNYTIWRFLKRCHEHGWIYKGHDVMPWCPRCGTAISDMEIATEGYRNMTHASVYVRFPLANAANEALLVWTTTPWTLTANVAAAVHPGVMYVKVRQGDQTLILAESCVGRALHGPYTVLERVNGSELDGLRYRGPFDELNAQRGVEHRVVLWKDVTESEGAGIVHIAPGCGKEDFALGREYGLAVVAPLDETGCYTNGYDWLAGRYASEVAQDVFRNLEQKGLAYRVEDVVHRYPVCWRCDTELLFRLVDEWFISMDDLRNDIMRVVDNITWIPSFCRERELDWLRNMADWCISKKRYWGLALPIYECACGAFDVVGAEEELRARAVAGWDQFEGHSPHRPWVDAVKVRCDACGGAMTRILDVGNPWLDAGIVPFSTLGYRRDRAYWSRWFPADFITECFPGQFRNWFYALLTMSTVLENREPFKTLLGHASVHDENGEEMHKSKGNAIWFDDAVEKMGADVMRWMFAAHPVATNLLFGYSAGQEIRRKLMTLWNVCSFFVTYANLDKPALSGQRENLSDMDRWMLSVAQSLVRDVTDALERYDAAEATSRIEAFLDNLSNWYVRRCRRRFWKSTHDTDKAAAYQTLYDVLSTLLKLLAPILPFTSEELYQAAIRPGYAGAPESIHLCDWPQVDDRFIDPGLEDEMRAVMELTRLGLSARNEARIKVRQPLQEAKVVVPNPTARRGVERFRDQILQELNVKSLTCTSDADAIREYVIKPNWPVLGPRLGHRKDAVVAALAAANAAAVASVVNQGQPFDLKVGSERISLAPDEVTVEIKGRGSMRVAEGNGYVVGIDTTITEDLRQEGIARDFVRHVQNLRKDAGLEVHDRIVIRVAASAAIAEALDRHQPYIVNETLANDVLTGADEHGVEIKLAGQKIRVHIEKA